MPRTGPLTRNTSAVALGLAQVRIGNSADNITSTTASLSSSNSIGAMDKTTLNCNVDLWKLESGFPMLEDLTIPIRETANVEGTFKELSAYNVALARGIDPDGEHAATVTEDVSKDSVAGTTTGSITVGDTDGPVTDTWTVVFHTATTGTIFGNTTGVVHDFATLVSSMEPQNSNSTASPNNPYFTIPSNFFTGTWAAGDIYVFNTTAYDSGDTYGVHSGTINLGGIVAPEFIRMEALYTFPNGSNTMTIIFPRCNVTSALEVDLQAEDAAVPPITFEAKRSDQDVAGGNAVWDNSPLGVILFA